MQLNKHISAVKKIVLQTSGLNLPQSLLIIPDGNGRWAKQMGLNVSEGHKMGGKTITKVIEDFMQINIKFLGIWGFSEDNWKREPEEIIKIMEVIENTLSENEKKFIDNNIKFICLGERKKIQKLNPSLFSTIIKIENSTKKGVSKTLVLFLSYGERFQLEEFAKARLVDKSSSTYDLLSKINGDIPLFDMVLRTSGEQRLSGFGPLASLAEFVSVNKKLPDLTDNDILQALIEYSNRQRRFGGR